MPPFALTLEALQLWKNRFREIPLYCANESAPGIQGAPEEMDWTLLKTTEDQERIEAYVSSRNIDGNVLHVGIGNSGLAQSFHTRMHAIVGITIQRNELQKAESLDIKNYFPLYINKYSTEMLSLPRHKFDFVIDNNPTSFCCCFLHFSRMMLTYQELLCDGGEILTDRLGLSWVVSGGHPRWNFTFTDWSEVAHMMGLVVKNIDDDVYAIQRQFRQKKSMTGLTFFKWFKRKLIR